ncbi:MAG: type II secretion system protein [Planctomycetota bacterium]
MPSARPFRRRSGFTLIELLVVVAIIALLIGILLPSLGKARNTAKTSVCTSNMRQYGVAATTFSADNDGFIANFDTRFARNETDTAQQAWRLHALAILEEETGSTLFAPAGWIPTVKFSHLVLIDYLSGSLPELGVVCPSDRVQADRLLTPLDEYVADEDLRRIAIRRFESSYEQVPFCYSPDSGPAALAQLSSGASYSVTNATFLRRRSTEVSFPGSKVFLMDDYDRHFANPTHPKHDRSIAGFDGEDALYYAVEDAKQPLLFFDGSVRSKRTDEGNPGYNPQDPTDPDPQQILYGHPSPNRFVHAGWYRWTRGGLRGVDFGGNDINTGQE